MNRKKVIWLFNHKAKNNIDYSPAIIWWYGILEKFGYEVLYEPYEDYDIEDFYKAAKKYNPDFIIHACYDKIHPELIRVREFCELYVLQSDDRWRYDNFSKFWIPYIDGVITFEGDEEKYKEDGLDMDKFCKIRWCFNPNVMRSDLDNDKDIIVSHTGGLHGDRKERINELISKGVDVKVFENIPYEQTKDIWNRTKYNLCFTMNSLCNMRELKGRVVEIPNYGPLVSEPWPGMEDYYNEDEFILFNSAEELIDKMKHYDNNINEYVEIYNRGKEALWSRNTVYHEWSKILPKIDKDFKKVNVNKILKEHHGR